MLALQALSKNGSLNKAKEPKSPVKSPHVRWLLHYTGSIVPNSWIHTHFSQFQRTEVTQIVSVERQERTIKGEFESQHIIQCLGDTGCYKGFLSG